VCLNFVYNFCSKRFYSSKCLDGYRDVDRNACKVSVTVTRVYRQAVVKYPVQLSEYCQAVVTYTIQLSERIVRL